MAKQQSIAEARRSLPSLVRDVESGKSVELTRRGQPVALLIGRREYERLAFRHRRFSEAYADFTRDINLKELAIDPNEVFAGGRDEARGREAEL
jgi:prevent-host-death family protein